MISVAQDDGWIEVPWDTTQNEEMMTSGDTFPHIASTDTLAGSTEVPVTSMEQRQPHETKGKNRWYDGCLEAEGGEGNCPNRGQPLKKNRNPALVPATETRDSLTSSEGGYRTRRWHESASMSTREDSPVPVGANSVATGRPRAHTD